MSASTVSLILTIVLAVFLVWGAVWGLIRGLKNTLYRGAFLAIVVVIAFFIASAITTLLLNLKIGETLNLEVGGAQAETLKEYMTLYVQNELQISADATGAISAIAALISIVLNAIIFVLMFWLIKWILSPVYSIITRFVLNRKQYKKEKIEKKNGKVKVKRVKVKTKKHRLFGGLVGIALGLFVCTFTFVPVLGYLNVMRKVETGTKEGETGVVSNMLGSENYNAIVDGYDQSVFGGVLKYSGMEFISSVMFDSLTTAKVDKTRVSLNKEVDTGIELYNLVKDTSMPDLNTCTQDELDSFLTNARQLINITFKSGIINSSLDGFMPLIVDYLQQQDMIDDLEAYEKVLVVNALTTLAEYHSEGIKTELLAIIGFVETLNDYGLLLPVIQNTTGDIVPFLQATTNHNVVNNVLDKLFALKMVDKVAPDLVNLMLNFVSISLDIESDDLEEITSAQLKTSLQNILTSAVDLVHQMDMDSQFYVKTSGITSVGKMIDSVKNSDIVSDEMFDSIIDKVQDTMLEQIDTVPAWAQSVAREAINNLSNVQNYTSEFEKIYSVVTDVEEACKKDGETTSDFAEMNFAKLGTAIDTLEQLVLVGRDNVEEGEPNNLVKKLLIDVIEEYVDDPSLNTEISTFSSIDQIKANIKASTNVEWKTEMPKIKALLVNAKNIMTEEGSIIDKLRDDSRKNDFVVMGEALDEAKTSVLFANNVDRLFMTDLLNIVDDSYQEDADMLDAIDSIKENINTASTISWGTEFGCIVDLVNMDFDNVLQENTGDEKSQAYLVGEKIDGVVGVSVLITEEIVDKFICTVVKDNFQDSSYENITEKLTANFEDVDKDATNGYQNNIDSYAVEFDALNNLYQAYLLVSDPSFNLASDAEELGSRLETAMKTSAIVNNVLSTTTLVSEELVDVMVNDVIDEKFDATNEDFASTLAKVKANFSDIDGDSTNGYQNNIESYTVEIMALSKLEAISSKANSAGFDFKTDGRELGRDLDDAVNTTYLFAGTTYRTKVVNEELVDEYVRELIDKNVTGDADLGPTIEAIKDKFDDNAGVEGYQNYINYYEVEFDALSRLLDVVDVAKSGFDGSDANDRLALATKLDLAMASVDIGTVDNPNIQKAQSVTPATINPYIKTKITFDIEGDYSSVVDGVKANITAYLDGMQEDADKTYTKCFTAINDLDAVVEDLTSITTGNTWLTPTTLETVEIEVDVIQRNILGGAILGREVMLIVVGKLDSILQTTVSTSVYESEAKYLIAYKQYLNTQNTEFEPYTSTTTIKVDVDVLGEIVSISTNKPLQFIYDRFMNAA